MTINRLHKIFAVAMAFLVFFASIGYAVDVHYCKGEFKSFSLMGKAKSCHEMATGCPHHSGKSKKISKKGCCTNSLVKVDNIKINYGIATTIDAPIFGNPQLFEIPYNIFWNNIIVTEEVTPLVDIGKDPLPSRDIYALFETYLL